MFEEVTRLGNSIVAAEERNKTNLETIIERIGSIERRTEGNEKTLMNVMKSNESKIGEINRMSSNMEAINLSLVIKWISDIEQFIYYS